MLSLRFKAQVYAIFATVFFLISVIHFTTWLIHGNNSVPGYWWVWSWFAITLFALSDLYFALDRQREGY